MVAILLLDTDVLIDIQRAHKPAVAWFSGLPEVPTVPGIVVMELVQDAHNASQVSGALRLVAPFRSLGPHKRTVSGRFLISPPSASRRDWACLTLSLRLPPWDSARRSALSMCGITAGCRDWWRWNLTPG